MVSAISPIIDTVRSIYELLDIPRESADIDGRSVHVLSDPFEAEEAGEAHFDRLSFFMQEVQKTCARAAKFFLQIYADIRLFIRAWSQVPSLSQEGALNASRGEVERFRDRCRAASRQRIDCVQEFRNLSSVTRDLFYQIDDDFLIEYRHETDPEVRKEMKRDITRECDRILQYQRIVYFFSLLFKSAGVESDGEMGSVFSAVANSGETVNGVRVNIPGTIPFVQEQVPREVQQKAAEIEELIEQYDDLDAPPKSPEVYICPVMQDFMKIPVFDASHPQVQASLANLPAPGNPASITEGHRTLRHAIESTAHLGLSAPGKCPSCRHPPIGGMRSEYMRIDTQLQDEILEFLRRAVENG